MHDELRDGDLKRIEHLLKKDMAKRMGALQEDRSAGPAGSVNVGSARSYVMAARTLRRVLLAKEDQDWVPVREMHGGDEWLDADVIDAAGVKNSDRLAEVCEKVHRVGNPNFDPPTATEHSNVPGVPST